MKRFHFTLFTVYMITLSVLQAQNNGLSLLISGNAALPTGDFGKDIGENPHMTRRAGFDFGEDVGLAQTGFGLGAELITPVGFQGLDWIVSARVLGNSVNGSAVEGTFNDSLLLPGDTVKFHFEFEFGNWINIPVMTGFRYNYSLTPNLNLYGLIQAGINVSKAASRKAVRPELTVGDTTFKDFTVEETTYNFARDFGFEFGLGIELAHKFNLGFRYLALNSPRYEGTRELSEKQFPGIFSRKTTILGEPRRISIFLVSLGFYLF